MTVIKSNTQYQQVCERIEELLAVVGNDTSSDNKDFIELDLLTDLVADYKEEYIPIEAPTRIEVIKLRIDEMGLSQAKLSALLGVSSSRVSEYLNGKSELTLKVARTIGKKLNIDANLVSSV